MLTARDDVDERVQALDAGVDDYLTKPFNLKELHARVRPAASWRLRAGCTRRPVALRSGICCWIQSNGAFDGENEILPSPSGNLSCCVPGEKCRR